jgi:hypothetical protein
VSIDQALFLNLVAYYSWLLDSYYSLHNNELEEKLLADKGEIPILTNILPGVFLFRSIWYLNVIASGRIGYRLFSDLSN